ncbi:MAG: hypothetical protein IPJ56_09045 [Gemmatimonadetes bacterium]|nr:hypothetical protein [Gemmatimonadota bacterium]
MTTPLTPQDRAAFYAAAVLGLRALDARETTPRRLGADAETRWTQFAGALGAGDRIDILLRDAAGTWGAAFSPSECFGFFGLADDEPFGPDWGGIDDHAAKRLLAEPDAPSTLEHVAYGLGVKAAQRSGAVRHAVDEARRRGRHRHRFGRQGVRREPGALLDRPGRRCRQQGAWRQLAGLAAVLLGARGRTALVRPTEGADSALRAAGFAHLDAAVVSPDAEPEAAELARKVGGK